MPKDKRAQIYRERVKALQPKSKASGMCVRAFFVGGLICCIGQLIRDFGEKALKLTGNDLSTFTCVVLIFLGALTTGLGIYDRIAKFAGAGTSVPITGFANSMTAPAMEYKKEGFISGLGTRLFSIAGPVLTYGVAGSVIVGLLSLIFH
ncbi:MAG: stage V sporulation protein AC [Clostridiales bacterium]|jgi:stage V sporulation protein AC|nr:stage V sporulation protein AC [Clostridiales bacterium]